MKEITAEQVFSINNESEFENVALQAFKDQAENIVVYSEFIRHLNIDPHTIQSINEIPFLPIEFFKSNIILNKHQNKNEIIFTSSGTTGMEVSKHYVSDLSIYKKSFMDAFRLFYGEPESYIILALLPSYLERDGSSLVYMADQLIKESKDIDSGFYLDEFEKIKTIILKRSSEKKIMLLGVTYALLDFAEVSPFEMKNTIIMETGGMKGKRKEMLREEIHEILKNSFKLKNIHSEYGMTELLSQAYSKGNGIFQTPPWMKILIRETHDPFAYCKTGRTGGINIIDLANINSCSFIATQDLGKIYTDNSFEVLGRFDQSDIRGCNLLVQ